MGQSHKPYRIIHDKYKKKGNSTLEEELIRDFDHSMSLNKDFEAGLKKAFEELDPLKALALFDNI